MIKARYLFLIGVLIWMVALLSGCASEDYIVLRTNITSTNTTITNNITNNVTNNITNNITNNNTFTVSNSSFQCSGTNKLFNVSILGGNISGVCSADLGTVYTSDETFINKITNQFNFNYTYALSQFQNLNDSGINTTQNIMNLGFYNSTYLNANLIMGGVRIYWLTNQTNANGTKNMTLTLPTDNMSVISTPIGTSQVTLGRFITQKVTNTTVFSGGMRRIYLDARVTDSSRVVQLTTYVYRCINYNETNDTCDSVSAFATSTSSTTLTTVFGEYEMNYFVNETFLLNASDRFVLNITANKTLGSATSVELVVGDSSFSRIEVPSPVGVTDISSKANIGNCSNGFVVQNTTTSGVQCVPINNITKFYPSNVTVTGGTNTTGNLTLIQLYDDRSYNFTEGGGVNPLDVYINFTNVTQFGELVIREFYNDSSHQLNLNLWDYTSSSWETYTTITSQSGFNIISLPVYDYASHVSGGIVQIQLHQVQNGNPTHQLSIDFIWLLSQIGGGTTDLTQYYTYTQDYNNDSLSWYSITNPNNFINSTPSNQNLTSLNVSGMVKLMNDTIFDGGTLVYNASTDTLSMNNSNVQSFENAWSRRTYYHRFDFESITAGYTDIWVTTGLSSGTSPLVSGNDTHSGISTPSTSTTASSGHCWAVSGATTYLLNAGYFTNLVFKPISHTYGGINLSNATYGRFGFMDTFTASESVDGVYFNISQNTPFNNASFEVVGVASNNSIRNFTATRFNLTNNTWYDLNIYIYNKTLAIFNVYSESGVKLWTDNITVTSQQYIPVTAGRETSHGSCFWTTGNTTLQVLANDDYIDVGINKSVQR